MTWIWPRYGWPSSSGAVPGAKRSGPGSAFAFAAASTLSFSFESKVVVPAATSCVSPVASVTVKSAVEEIVSFAFFWASRMRTRRTGAVPIVVPG